FLEMKLIDAAAIRLRNRDEVVVDLNLFALFRQMTEQMGDVPADGAHIRALQFKLGEFVQFVKSQSAVHGEFVCVNLAKLLLLKIELVLNITDQFLEHIFQRHHADRAAKFINYQRKMGVLA